MTTYTGTINFVMGARLNPNSLDSLVELFNQKLKDSGIEVSRCPESDKPLKKAIKISAPTGNPDSFNFVTRSLEQIIESRANEGNPTPKPSFVTVTLQEPNIS